MHLGEVAEIINGRPFKPHEWSKSGLPIIRIQNLNGSDQYNYYDGKFDPKVLVRDGELLFAWSGSRGTSFGPHFWYGGNALLNYHTWKVLPYKNVDRHFLYYALAHITDQIEQDAHGAAGLVHVQKSWIVDYLIPLPPLPEQRAIAAILSTWDEAITLTTQLIDALKRRKQALMQLLLTGQVRFPGFEGKWEEVEIGDLLTESRISGSTGAKARKLTVKLYGKGVIPKAKTKQGSENTTYYVRKAGQFIYSKLDFLNGAFGIIPNHLDGYETTLDLPAFDISPLVEASYLLNYVSREEFYKGFLRGARGGRKAKRIQHTEFLSASILLPTMQEQSKMVTMITLLENYEEAVNSLYKAMSKQKRGLMHQLLTGAVRVGVGEE